MPIAKIAAKIMVGDSLGEVLKNYQVTKLSNYNVKESVFPFNKLDGVDLILGPEMKSTGEVMGIDDTFLSSYIKSQIACGNILPSEGNVFVSIDDDNKESIISTARKLIKMKFNLFATKGTAKYLNDNQIKANQINKVKEGNPHIVDSLINKKIDLVINTTKSQSSVKDSYSIRRTSLMYNIPYYTTIAGAKIAVDAIEHIEKNDFKIKSLQTLN